VKLLFFTILFFNCVGFSPFFFIFFFFFGLQGSYVMYPTEAPSDNHSLYMTSKPNCKGFAFAHLPPQLIDALWPIQAPLVAPQAPVCMCVCVRVPVSRTWRLESVGLASHSFTLDKKKAPREFRAR
jgi:hypothetical protein